MKVNCLFCNRLIEVDIQHATEKCSRCKSHALLLIDFNGDIYAFLQKTHAKEKIDKLKRENKIRSLVLNPEHLLLMYYPFTSEELSRVFSKPTLKALNKILNNEQLENKERQRIARMKSIAEKTKKNLELNKFINDFEYPCGQYIRKSNSVIKEEFSDLFWMNESKIKILIEDFFNDIGLEDEYEKGNIIYNVQEIPINQLLMEKGERITKVKPDTYYKNKIIKYKEKGLDSDKIFPLIVKKEGRGFILMDGYHRVSALHKFGITTAICIVYEEI